VNKSFLVFFFNRQKTNELKDIFQGYLNPYTETCQHTQANYSSQEDEILGNKTDLIHTIGSKHQSQKC